MLAIKATDVKIGDLAISVASGHYAFNEDRFPLLVTEIDDITPMSSDYCFAGLTPKGDLSFFFVTGLDTLQVIR